jgi:hypothetical protein
VATVCDLSEQAGSLAERGIHLVSTDEKTGIQALERLDPDIPAGPGRVPRREFEDPRPGPRCLTAHLELWCGRIGAPTLGPTGTEADFVAQVEQTVATDPFAGGIFIGDNWKTPQSESLVRWVAQTCGIEDDLGEQGKRGVLKSPARRAAFLSDPTHRIRFVDMPKPTSWLNQVELGFRILVRKLLRRSSCGSTEELKARNLALIADFNRTMAKPIRWLNSVEPKGSHGTG